MMFIKIYLAFDKIYSIEIIFLFYKSTLKFANALSFVVWVLIELLAISFST